MDIPGAILLLWNALFMGMWPFFHDWFSLVTRSVTDFHTVFWSRGLAAMFLETNLMSLLCTIIFFAGMARRILGLLQRPHKPIPLRMVALNYRGADQIQATAMNEYRWSIFRQLKRGQKFNVVIDTTQLNTLKPPGPDVREVLFGSVRENEMALKHSPLCDTPVSDPTIKSMAKGLIRFAYVNQDEEEVIYRQVGMGCRVGDKLYTASHVLDARHKVVLLMCNYNNSVVVPLPEDARIFNAREDLSVVTFNPSIWAKMGVAALEKAPSLESNRCVTVLSPRSMDYDSYQPKANYLFRSSGKLVQNDGILNMVYDASTSGRGSSGTPVFIGGKVVGIHVQSNTQTTIRKTQVCSDINVCRLVSFPKGPGRTVQILEANQAWASKSSSNNDEENEFDLYQNNLNETYKPEWGEEAEDHVVVYFDSVANKRGSITHDQYLSQVEDHVKGKTPWDNNFKARMKGLHYAFQQGSMGTERERMHEQYDDVYSDGGSEVAVDLMSNYKELNLKLSDPVVVIPGLLDRIGTVRPMRHFDPKRKNVSAPTQSQLVEVVRLDPELKGIEKLAFPPRSAEAERTALRVNLERVGADKMVAIDGASKLARRVVSTKFKTTETQWFPAPSFEFKDSVRGYSELRDELNATASPGYPFCYQYTRNGQVIDLEMPEVCRLVRHRILARLKATAAQCMDPLTHGLSDPIRIMVKNEPHAPEKMETGRYRLIFSPSLVDAIVDRILNAHLTKSFKEHHDTQPIKIGIDPHNIADIRALNAHVKKIAVDGTVWTEDISGFDWTAGAAWYEPVREFKKAMINAPDDCEFSRLLEASDLIMHNTPIACSDGALYRVYRGFIRSGMYDTSLRGSIVRYLSALCSGSGDAIVYGDDGIVSPYSIPWISRSPDSAFAFKQERHKNTTGLVLKYSSVEEADAVEFLGRKWTPETAHLVACQKAIFNYLVEPVTPETERAFAENLGWHPQYEQLKALNVPRVVGGAQVKSKEMRPNGTKEIAPPKTVVEIVENGGRPADVVDKVATVAADILSGKPPGPKGGMKLSEKRTIRIGKQKVQLIKAARGNEIAKAGARLKELEALNAVMEKKLKNMPKKQAKPKSDVNQIAASYVFSLNYKEPNMKSGKNSMRVTNSELVNANLVSSSSLNTLILANNSNINPGLSTSANGVFTWLNTIAGEYQEYRVHKLVFKYMPKCATSDKASVYTVIIYDAEDSTGYSELQVATFAGRGESVAYWAHECRMDVKAAMVPGPWKRVRSGNVAGDLNLYDAGIVQVYIADNGAASLPVGKLWVEYDIEFKKPEPALTGRTFVTSASLIKMSANQTITSTVNTQVLFDTAVTNFSGLKVKTDATGLMTPPQGTYVVTFNVTLSGVSAGNFTEQLQFYKGATLQGSNYQLVTIPANGFISLSLTVCVTANGTDTFYLSCQPTNAGVIVAYTAYSYALWQVI